MVHLILVLIYFYLYIFVFIIIIISSIFFHVPGVYIIFLMYLLNVFYCWDIAF